MVTATLFDTGIFSTLTSASAIDPGALLYWYAAGGTTPINTYTTSALSVANANPVVADANGRFPQIWLGTGPYKYVLKSAAGVTLKTVDSFAPLAGTLAGVTGAGLVGFSQSSTYAAGTDGLHDQNLVYVQDAPYSAILDGSTNDSTAFAAAIAATGAKRGVLSGSPGKSMRVNTAQDITTAITITGVVDQPMQAGSTLGSFALLGGSSSYILKFAAGSSGSKVKDIQIENVGTCQDGLYIGAATALHFENITSLNWASARTRFSRSLIYSNTGNIEYARLIGFNVYSTATPVVLYIEGTPNFAPFGIYDCHEFAALDNLDLTVVKLKNCGGDGWYMKGNTFNGYSGSSLTAIDTSETTTVVDYTSQQAIGMIDFSDNEIDITAQPLAFGKIYNVGAFSVHNVVTAGANTATLFELFNSRATIRDVQAASINGPYFKITDLESRVGVGDGINFSVNNTVGVFNSAVTLAAGSFTCSTVNNSYILTVTAVGTGLVHPLLAISGAGIPSTIPTIIQKQLTGTKGGAGTYLLTQAQTATASGITATQAAGTYPVTSGLYPIPVIVDVDNIFYIQPHLLQNGVEAFVINYDTTLVSGGVGLAIKIKPALTSGGAAHRPVSWFTRGQKIPIIFVNTSGVAMGAVTWDAAFKVSATIAYPGDGYNFEMALRTHQTISGSTATDVFRQIGPTDVPN